MYCVMRTSVPSLYNVYRRYDTCDPGDFNQTEVDQFVEESLKMSRFKHSHVMGLIGVGLDTGSAPFIIMPYMVNGSLLKYLRRERKNIVLSEEHDGDEVTLHTYSCGVSTSLICRYGRCRSV